MHPAEDHRESALRVQMQVHCGRKLCSCAAGAGKGTRATEGYAEGAICSHL